MARHRCRNARTRRPLWGNVFDAGNPCATTVISDGPVLAFAIGRELFESLYRSNPYFKEAIDQLVDHRERSLGTDGRVSVLAMNRVIVTTVTSR